MRSMIRSILLFVALTVSVIVSAQSQKFFYNVKELGARGDGTTPDTKIINKAIEDAATAGGGTIYFPAGNYLSGSIHLKSNICLFIEQGATLIASSDSNDFDKPEPGVNDTYQDYGHSHWHNSFIWGEKIHDVSIVGNGMIWGKGLVRSGRKGDMKPNKSIALLNCRNVTIKDISILHGGWFAILATGVDNFTLDNLKVDTNRDGFDIDCCKNVRVSNCTVNSPFDDGICLKSSFGLGYARPTENVTITNCQVSGYDEGTLLNGTFKRTYKRYSDSTTTGRIKFGTESNGGFKNITINNCVFDYSRGLALETVDGGLLEDVTISNITMRDIVNAPIYLRLGGRLRGPDGIKVGALRRVTISNVVAYNAEPKYASIVSGIPARSIEDLRLSNIHIYYKVGGTKEQAALTPPENENDYPEPVMFGEMPAYGFFIRHVKSLTMTDVELSFMKDDLRPAFVLSDVQGADFQRVKAQRVPGNPLFFLKDVADFNLNQVWQLPDMRLDKTAEKTF